MNGVSVSLAFCAADGIEAEGDSFGGEDGEVVGEIRVDREVQAFDGDAHGKVGREGGNLTFGADAGVGAAGAEDVDGLSHGATDGGFENALRGAEWFAGVLGFLFLPAVEVVAVVCDEEFESAGSGEIIRSRRVRYGRRIG